MLDDEPDDPIFLQLCCECNDYCLDWVTFPDGPVCRDCLDLDEMEDTLICEPEYGGNPG